MWLKSWQPEASDFKNGLVIELLENRSETEVIQSLVKIVMKIVGMKCDYSWDLKSRIRKLFLRTRAVMVKGGDTPAAQWTFLARLQEGGTLDKASLYEPRDPVLDLAARLTTLASTVPLTCARHGCKELGMLKVCQVIRVQLTCCWCR